MILRKTTFWVAAALIFQLYFVSRSIRWGLVEKTPSIGEALDHSFRLASVPGQSRQLVSAPPAPVSLTTLSFRNITQEEKSTVRIEKVWRLPPINATHKPSFFRDLPFDSFKHHGHIQSVLSGCRMAAYVYDIKSISVFRMSNDCSRSIVSDQRQLKKSSVLQPYDTVYVPFYKLEHFVQNRLNSIDVPIVLISGQWFLYKFPNETYDALINNTFIVRWFVQDLDFYAKDPDHPKLNSWPYGIKEQDIDGLRSEMLKPPGPKTNKIFTTFLSLGSKNPTRTIVQQGKKLKLRVYLRRMRLSEYVLAPDGDRPECFRHWEALALGTVPITELRPEYYRHFIGTGLMFQQTHWNVTVLNATLPTPKQPKRTLAFSEYWMDWVEGEVGHDLRWWDQHFQTRGTATEIAARWRDELLPNITGSTAS
jgi:hypothetical protein